MYWVRIAKKGCLVLINLVPLNESLGFFFTRKWRFLTRSSGLLWHIRYTYTMYQFGVIYIKTFPVHCNSLLSFDSVMCIIMRTATCDNIHVFSSADLKAQFRFTDHCSFVVRMSAKLFLEMIYIMRDHTTFQWEFIRKE